MAAFSLGEAAGAGLRLIRRHPGAVALWGLAYFAVFWLPLLLLAWMTAPGVMESLRQVAAQADAETSFAQMVELQSRFFVLRAAAMLLTACGGALLTGAIFRAVLRPEDSAFAFLRIGREELWLGLLILVINILAMIAGFVLGGAIALVAIVLWLLLFGIVGDAAVWLVMVPGVIAVVGVLIWLMVRLSLAAPMTFAEGRFRLFESWPLTRGHAGRLTVLGLLVFVPIFAVLLLFDGALLVGGIAAFGDGMRAGPAHAFWQQPARTWMGALAPWAVGGALIYSVVGAAGAAIVQAPWAVVYQRLAGGASAPPVAAAPQA